MGSPVYGLGFNRGVAVGIDRGIEIGLKMAADAAVQRRLQIATGALRVVQHATPAVLRAVSTYRATKVVDAAA
jgi:hypothetical protein